MRDVAHSAAPPDQAPYAVAEAVFADAKAYLSSREAQQMSESELERELHRRGQELMRRLLQGHLDQRTPGEAAGSVEGVDDVERSQRPLQERHPETTFGTVQVQRHPGGGRRFGRGGRQRSQRPLQERHARPSGRCRLRARAGRARRWRRDAAQPRERRRRPYGVVIDLIHVAEYVCRRCLCSHRHRRHRRGVRYLVRDRDGVHWCTLVLPSTAVSSMRGSGSAGWPTWLEPRRF